MIFCLKFTIRSNSHKFPTEFHENSEIPYGNSGSRDSREFHQIATKLPPNITGFALPSLSRDGAAAPCPDDTSFHHRKMPVLWVGLDRPRTLVRAHTLTHYTQYLNKN